MKVLDNKTQGFVYKELENDIRKGSRLSIISASFSMYAYEKLSRQFDKIDNMRFIYTRPSFLKTDDKEVKEFFIDNDLFGSSYELKLKNEMTQSSIARDCANWIKNKTEIKSFITPNEAQPRILCIENKNYDDVTINGTIDFTPAAFGIVKSDRSDYNMCVHNKLQTQNSLGMFESLWNSDMVVDVKQEVLDRMESMYEENSPEFLYFFSTYEIFQNNLDSLQEDKLIRKGNPLKKSQIWNKLYKFQKDAVLGVINKIENYNGCILADSVGLGKTFTALAVIKYYELRNDRVLVLVPKKLRDNWTVYTQNDKRNIFVDDRFNYDVLNHTDLSREKGKSGEINLETINWGNYDLVVIDESHNFRNNPKFKDKKTRYQKLMEEIIKGGHKTRVLMLSATPVNNRMTDIKNQIAFITEDNDSALEDIGIDSISYTLTNAQRIFNQWSKLPEGRRTSETFVNNMDLDYFRLLDALTIARSRKHIEKYYNIKEIGEFPSRRKPLNIYSDFDTEGNFPSIEHLNNMINRLNLGFYSPLNYVLPNKRDDYSKKYDTVIEHSVFKQTDRDNYIVGLVRINILKRMESSIEAFRLTLERILHNINDTLFKIENKAKFTDDNIDIDTIDPDEEQYDEMIFGRKRKVLLQDMDLIKWKEDLEWDKQSIEEILENARKITPARDNKLKDLKENIREKIHNNINPGNNKVIIFTAYSDTAKYLYDNINQWALDEYGLYSALVTGSGDNKSNLDNVRSTDVNDILVNFSPISKERDAIDNTLTDEIDILICTDCISEGQNLQDCDYLINYDIHWNPVRIIQRFGRIDRIGSKNKEIQLVNFWPNMELNEYINLTERVENRMVMVDVSATGEENIISDTGKMNNLEYRRNQLEKLQDEVLDLEDVSDAISITDLTFNDFKIELTDYLKEYKKDITSAPHGIYAVVDIDEKLKDEVEPGVIFLLKQVSGQTETVDNNALTPYYLSYITNQNEVKLNYIQSKKVLDYYKKLCVGKNEVLPDLIREFNNETNDGKDMTKYSALLVEVIENILGKKQETGVKSLFSKGGTATIQQDINGLEEFELISFLILR